jgi:NAD(P)-dependent dehydrogenase (short-subunit alcohol dehydrogenase family)
MDMKDRVAIVTGASSGIGLSTARLLAGKGARCVLAARSVDKLERLARELPGSLVVPTDMTKIDEVVRMVRKTIEHFGRVDILVNDAGQGYDAPVERTDLSLLHYVCDLDLVGPLVAMQQVIPVMRRQMAGTIVNISSGTALMQLEFNGGYSAIKAALAQLSLTARMELAKDGIVVSVVYPYITLTDFEKNTIKAPGLPEEEGFGYKPPDPPELVAGKILEAIQTGAAEVVAHEWMTKRFGNPR